MYLLSSKFCFKCNAVVPSIRVNFLVIVFPSFNNFCISNIVEFLGIKYSPALGMKFLKFKNEINFHSINDIFIFLMERSSTIDLWEVFCFKK